MAEGRWQKEGGRKRIARGGWQTEGGKRQRELGREERGRVGVAVGGENGDDRQKEGGGWQEADGMRRRGKRQKK